METPIAGERVRPSAGPVRAGPRGAPHQPGPATFPQQADHFFVGNAWEWEPPRSFRYVYGLLDSVPPAHLTAHLHRLLDRVVAPGGRLIVGAYGSRSGGIPARDVAAVFRLVGLEVEGAAESVGVHVTRFAWVERAG